MNEFTTNNLYMASYLATIGFSLLGVRPYNETILHFVFPLDNNILAAEKLYINGEALCNPVPYGENLKRIKSILYEYKLANGSDTKRGSNDELPNEAKRS